MKIRTQLILSITALVLVFLILAVTAVTTTSQEGRYEQQLARIEKTQVDLYTLNQLTSDYLFNREDRQKAQWETEYSTISSDLEGLQPTGPEQQALVNTIRNDQQHLQEIYSEVSSMIERMNAGGGTPQDEAFIATSWSRMAVQNQEMIAEASRLSGLIREDSEKVEEASSFLVYGLLGMILLILVMNYLVIYRRVLGSVDDLRSGMEVVRSGSLDYQIPEKGNDEFHTLAASFNAMTASRKKAEDTLQQKTMDLEAAYEEIAASEEELRKNYDDLSRSQQALEENEKRLRRFYDSGLIGVIYWTTDGKILEANDAFLTMTGYSRTDLESGRIDWAGMTPPEYHARDAASLTELKQEGRNRVPFEKEYIRKDGSRIPILIAGAMLDESRTRGVAFVLDITERKQAEIKLENSRNFLDSIIDQSPNPMWISDETGTLIRLNRACLELLRITPDEVVGKYNVFQDTIVLEQGKMPLVRSVFEEGASVNFDIEYDTTLLTTLPLERLTKVYLNVTIFPIRDTTGRVTNAVIQHLNFTERRNAEEALKESEARYRLISENTGDVIWLLDPDRVQFTFVSPSVEKMVGYTPEEILGQSIEKVLTPAAYEKALSELQTRIARFMEGDDSSRTMTSDIDTLHKDGTIVPTEVVSTILTDENGNVSQILGVSRDINERRKAEQALMASEQRYRNLFENMQEGLAYCRMIYDPDGTPSDFVYLSVNQAFNHIIGARTYTGRRATEVFPGIREETPYIFEIYGRVARSGTPESFEGYFSRAGKWLHVSVYCPSPDHFVAIFTDISDRKNAEVAREENARQRQLALDAARLGWWYYNPLTGISTYDRRYQEIFGVSGHERPNDEILTLLHPDDRQNVWAAVQAALDPRDPKPYATEYRINAADGVIRWVRAFGIATFEGSGTDRHAVSFVGTVEDITESKAIEQVLRESEERFREIFNNANDGIELIELTNDGNLGRFIEVNQVTCRTVQYTREELLAMGPFDLNTGEFTPPLPEVLRELKDTGHATFETEHRRKDGTIFPVEISSHSVSWKDRRALISVVRDITERKAAEELIHVMNLKLALMNDVTYQDVQNKVTAVRGYMDLYNRVPGEEERTKIAGKITTVLGSIQTLIQKTKEYQRMGVAKSQWIDVEYVVRAEFSDISDTHHVSLETDLHGLRVNTDPLINRVFYNLLHNTIAHGKTATWIRVSSRETGDGVKLEFEDNGVGISADAKSSIFDRVVAGEGKFGLFFVREFLSISGMTIIENGEPGKGARFVITIPHGMYRFST